MRVPYGSRVNDSLHSGYTPLSYAASVGSTGAVQLLVEAKAHVNGADANRQVPLHCAARHGHVHVVRLLVWSKANVDSMEHVPDRGWDCLGYRVGYDDRGCTALYTAVAARQVEVVRELVGAKAHVDVCDREYDTALSLAVRRNCIGAVEALLAAKATVDKRGCEGQRPMYLALLTRRHDSLELLLRAKASVHFKDHGELPMFLAVKSGAPSGRAVRLLLAAKADADVADFEGRSALRVAEEFGNRSMVRLLLAAKASAEGGYGESWEHRRPDCVWRRVGRQPGGM